MAPGTLTRRKGDATRRNEANWKTQIRRLGSITVRKPGTMALPKKATAVWSTPTDSVAGRDGQLTVVAGSARYVKIVDHADPTKIVAVRAVRPPHLSALAEARYPRMKFRERWRRFGADIRKLQEGKTALKRRAVSAESKKQTKKEPWKRGVTNLIGLTAGAGIRKNPDRKENKGKPVSSYATASNPDNDWATSTKAHQELSESADQVALHSAVLRAIEADTRLLLRPEYLVANERAVASLHPKLRANLHGLSLFGQTEIISSAEMKAHVDKDSVKGTMSAVFVTYDGTSVRGGSQIFPLRGLELTFPPGTLVLAPYGDELHGVAPMSTSANNNRVAVVAFIGKKVVAASEKMRRGVGGKVRWGAKDAAAAAARSAAVTAAAEALSLKRPLLSGDGEGGRGGKRARRG
jgi:hypothetical protein